MAKANWIQISIMYPGSVISVNHYKYSGGRYTRPEVKEWMAALSSIIRLALKKNKVVEPVQIELLGRFKDWRIPDLANLHKVIGDSLEEALGINDKYFEFHDKGYTIDGNADPMLYIRLKVK